MKHKQITLEEREYIEFLRNDEKRSIKKIAHILKRSKSSISEELHRIEGTYSAKKAERHRYLRQYHKTKDWMKIAGHIDAITYIERHMKDDDWSPEEIVGRIKYVDKHITSFSTPSVYKYIYSIYGRKLEKYLRYGKKNTNGCYKYNVKIDGRTFIDKRPKRVAARRYFGDWEADFICSGKNGTGYLLVFVERKTRFVVIRKIYKKEIEIVQKIFEEVLGVKYIVNTLTIDNDIVFRRHEELSKVIGAPVFFTHPYHSWEKGTVENMNKWIRQYVKKGSDISSYSDDYIRIIEYKLNSRPRKCLKFNTPQEAVLQDTSLKKEIVMIQSKILIEEGFGLGV